MLASGLTWMKGRPSRCLASIITRCASGWSSRTKRLMRSVKSGSVASSECFCPMSDPNPRSASCERIREIICSAVLSSSSVASEGCCCEKRLSNGGSSAPAVRWPTASTTRPSRSCDWDLQASTDSSISRSARTAVSTIISPALVMRMRRPRTTRGWPSSSSIRLIRWLIAGCVSCRLSAASVKLPDSATAARARSCCSEISSAPVFGIRNAHSSISRIIWLDTGALHSIRTPPQGQNPAP